MLKQKGQEQFHVPVPVPVLFNRCSSCSCHIYLLAIPNKTYYNMIRNVT